MILLYITCKDGNEAWAIAHRLLDNKLAGCAVTFPIRSMYWWDGKVMESGEEVLLIKTTSGRFKKVKKMVEELHSYDTPCIIRIDCKGSEKYEAWLRSVVK